MKSYGQYRALARVLDVIGDRWVLLIVRELLSGPRRYDELTHGLPGIATNLLAERLRTLQGNGVIAKADDDRYELTEWGEGLREVVLAIGRWASPLMGRIAEGDTFRSRWIAHPVADMFPGIDRARPELTIEVRCGDEPMTIRSAAGRVSVYPGPADAPDLVLTDRHVAPAGAKAAGLVVTGDVRLLRRLRPNPPGVTAPAR